MATRIDDVPTRGFSDVATSRRIGPVTPAAAL